MKLNHPAWNSPNANSSAQATLPYQSSQQVAQNGAQHQPSQANAPLGGPPGVPPPSQFAQQPPHLANAQGQTSAQPPQTQNAGSMFATGNGIGAIADNVVASLQPTPLMPGAHPQTPAQQVLISAADRWGLLGLIMAMKSADPESSLLAMGTDLGTMGLDMTNQG